jgi:hypothetical protein
MIDLPPERPRKAKKIRESDVEAYLVAEVEKRGGVAEKFSSPAKRSVPDRLILWPGIKMSLSVVGAKVHFVECKAPGEMPTPAQLRDHKRRRDMGFHVWVVDSYESVDNYLRGAV